MSVILTQLFWFVVVGTIGFVVDTAVLYAGIGAGLGYYGGRVVSYVCAATTTWFLNRRWTFKSTNQNTRSEWARFVVLNLGGFIVNYGTYVICLQIHHIFIAYPVLAVAAGSAAGLVVNFLINKFVVFKVA
ncbi:MAG: GtrA family protein [Bdellovibrionales bacterium]